LLDDVSRKKKSFLCEQLICILTPNHLLYYYNINIQLGYEPKKNFLDFGLSWLTSLQFIVCYVAGFYKPTIPQSPPSHCGITAHATMPG
jgi:hypothetical protein